MYFEELKINMAVDIPPAVIEKEKLLDVITSREASDDGINVYIGREDADDAMRDTTLIYRNVTVGGKKLAFKQGFPVFTPEGGDKQNTHKDHCEESMS